MINSSIVSDPTNPVIIGDSPILSNIEKKLKNLQYIHGVWVKDNYAYLADNGEQVLTVINIKE